MLLAEEALRTGLVEDAEGNPVRLSSAISSTQGKALASLIRANPNIERTLEIGCAHGISSLYICEALRDRPNALHTIIDPAETSYWSGVGIAGLKRANLSNFRLIEDGSEFALPSLLKKGDSYDFIFIDGVHRFDHAMMDTFFCVRLLRVGGFIAFDDTDKPPIMRICQILATYDFLTQHSRVNVPPSGRLNRVLARIGGCIPLSANLKHYVPKQFRGFFRSPRTVIFQKTGKDNRDKGWYRPF